MIPIRDQIKTRRVPIINTILILINILMFVSQWFFTHEHDNTFVYQLAFIPAQFLAAPFKPATIGQMFTAMFMHAGFLHLAGNMLYLWIFGDKSRFL